MGTCSLVMRIYWQTTSLRQVWSANNKINFWICMYGDLPLIRTPKILNVPPLYSSHSGKSFRRTILLAILSPVHPEQSKQLCAHKYTIAIKTGSGKHSAAANSYANHTCNTSQHTSNLWSHKQNEWEISPMS